MHAALDINLPNYASAIVTTNEIVDSISKLRSTDATISVLLCVLGDGGETGNAPRNHWPLNDVFARQNELNRAAYR